MRNPEGIAAAVRMADSVCICCHISPDGDTIGSALAMRLILREMGKTVSVFCQDKVPDDLSFLPGVTEIRRPETNTAKYDLFLAVDVSDPARLGCGAELMRCCAHSAQIDHHGTNPGYTEVNSVDGEAAATCAMLWEQMRAMGVPLNREIATCLYAGISTDTGNFSFDCTNAEAFQVMGELVKAGLPLADLNMLLFRQRSMAQLKLLGRAIEGMRREEEDRIAVMKLTRADFRACGALSEHADTVVNFGLETKGTLMAVLARENDDGSIKFSLRARAPLTVDAVAAKLGGGGHAQAAGISMEGTLEATTRVVLREMAAHLRSQLADKQA